MLDLETKEFILRRFFREIYKDQKMDLDENKLLNDLLPYLKIEKAEISRIRDEVIFLAKRQPAIGDFDLESFILDVRQFIEEKYDKPLAIKVISDLLSHLKLDKSEYLPELDSSENLDSEIEKSLSKEMDPDCKALLIEVYQKDWELELDSFKERLVEDRVDEELRKMTPKLQEKAIIQGAIKGAPLGIILGLILGPTALVVWPVLAVLSTVVALTLSMGTLGFFIGAASGFFLPLIFILINAMLASWPSFLLYSINAICASVLGAAIGAGLNMRIFREKLLEPDSFARVELREKFREYNLSPKDLLRFWELKLDVFLKERKARVNSRIIHAEQSKKELEKLLNDIHTLKMDEMLGQVKPIKTRIANMQKLIKDAYIVDGLLQKLENRFSVKIIELRELVEKQNQAELLYDQKRALGGRVAKALGNADSQNLAWEAEKKNLDSAIFGMVEAFQSQLTTTKDFVEAEIQLLENN